MQTDLVNHYAFPQQLIWNLLIFPDNQGQLLCAVIENNSIQISLLQNVAE